MIATRFTHRWVLRAALAACWGAPGMAAAEADLTRLPLERLLEMRVTAASSYDQSSAEAPSSVSVITAEEIRKNGYRTLAEALASLPGLYVTDDLSWGYIGSRGFNRIGDYNSRVQLSVNGLRTNDALFDMAYVGSEFPLDMALIERIEFAPGPGSSIYGSNAMLGVVNVVTRTAASLAGPRVALATGSNGLRTVEASFGKRFDNGLEVLAAASGLRTHGQDLRFPEFDAPQTGSGLARGQNGENYRRGYLRATYGGFDLEVLAGRRDKLTPSIYDGSDFLRNETRVIDSMGIAALRYRARIEAHTELEARVSTGRYDYTGIYPALGFPDSRDDAAGRWRGAELRIVSSYIGGHKLVAGAEVQQDRHLDQVNADTEAVYLDRHDSGRRAAVYVQDEWRLTEGWLLNAGMRYDRYYSFGASTNPRVALIGKLSTDTTVKLLHGSAFRAPNAYELYYESNGFSSNGALGPERMRSTEAAIEQRVGESLVWRASLFHYRFDDLIEQMDEGEELVFRNRGSVTGRGAEGSATLLLGDGARLDASASLHDVRQSDGQRATNSPRYTAKASYEAPFAGGAVTAALRLLVVGPRLDRDRARVPASVVANLVLATHQPWRGATFTLGIYNLFDRHNRDPVSEYYVPAQVPGLARNVRIGAEWRF
jgi:iron complex outermembrane receptor protein